MGQDWHAAICRAPASVISRRRVTSGCAQRSNHRASTGGSGRRHHERGLGNGLGSRRRVEISDPGPVSPQSTLPNPSSSAAFTPGMLHRSGRYVTEPRAFRGVGDGPRNPKIPLKSKGLCRASRAGAEPADLTSRAARRGRRRSDRFRHGGPLRDARCSSSRSKTRPSMRSRPISTSFDAHDRRERRPRPPGAQPGVRRRRAEQGARRGARQGRHRRARRRISCKLVAANRRLFAVARHDPRLPRAGRRSTRARSPPRSPSPRRSTTRSSTRLKDALKAVTGKDVDARRQGRSGDHRRADRQGRLAA